MYFTTNPYFGEESHPVQFNFTVVESEVPATTGLTCCLWERRVFVVKGIKQAQIYKRKSVSGAGESVMTKVTAFDPQSLQTSVGILWRRAKPHTFPLMIFV